MIGRAGEGPEGEGGEGEGQKLQRKKEIKKCSAIQRKKLLRK